jgi:hypothetical protein
MYRKHVWKREEILQDLKDGLWKCEKSEKKRIEILQGKYGCGVHLIQYSMYITRSSYVGRTGRGGCGRRGGGYLPNPALV